jgi:hypothetical protein
MERTLFRQEQRIVKIIKIANIDMISKEIFGSFGKIEYLCCRVVWNPKR